MKSNLNIINFLTFHKNGDKDKDEYGGGCIDIS